MRKKLLSLVLVGVMLCTVSCGAEEKAELRDSVLALEQEKEALNSSVENLNEDNKKLQSELDSLDSELTLLRIDFEVLSKEYDNYKEKTKPYEALSIAEAEAQTAKAAKEKAAAEKALKEQEAAEKAEKERLEKEKAEKAAAEEAKGYETGITYNQLARTPDEYKGQKVKFKGKVAQVVEGDGEVNIRLVVDDNYNHVLLGAYLPKTVSSRILENDIVTIYGNSMGLHTYESVMGGTITIPLIWIDRIDQ